MRGPVSKLQIPFWATLLTLCGVTVLCALGGWQVKRLAWKKDILTVIAAEQTLDANKRRLTAEDLRPQLSLSGEAGSSARFFYRRGTVEGVLDFEKEIALGPRTYKGRVGYHILTPLRMADGAVLLVNRGWRSAAKGPENKEEASIPLQQQRSSAFNRAVTVTGALRLPDWNVFTPRNDPARGQWFRADTREIATALALPALLPVVLYAENASIDFPDTQIQATGLSIRNNHLQYALFWYSLALVLLAVYGLYVYRINDKKEEWQSAGKDGI